MTSQTLQRHYTDGGDNPTWTDDTRGGTTTTTRYAELASGNLGLTFTTTVGTTKAELAIPGLRGDIATTLTIPTGSHTHDGTAITTIDTWADYDEYGQPKQAVTHNPGGIQGIGYGWLGQHERATTDTGLILMGARLYNSATGTFTSLDPTLGSNETGYGYPNDPINSTDITGQWMEQWAGALGLISDISGMIPSALCPVCGGLSAVSGVASAALHYASGNVSAAKARLINTAIGLVAGTAGRLATKAIMGKVIAGWSKGATTAKRAVVVKRKIAKLRYKISRLKTQIRRAVTLKKNRVHRDYVRAQRAVSLFGDSISYAITAFANRRMSAY
ncbi:MAG: RHS repeat-associated core domain-containing protein [Micropruina sp.]|uniref:RHS repeat-associated core domain-containing protein n=1 Tax=Micropruina sp. TaxID=2737536 RepID=UPI0039E6FF45